MPFLCIKFDKEPEIANQFFKTLNLAEFGFLSLIFTLDYTIFKMKVEAQFTIDNHKIMVINYCNKNGARTMAFIIMEKVAQSVFTTFHS